MTIYTGSLIGIIRQDLDIYENILDTFVVDFSGVIIKERNLLSPVASSNINKKVSAMPKELVLWSLSMED